MFAIATGDTSSGTPAQPVVLDLASMKRSQDGSAATVNILINDMAVQSREATWQGRGPEAKPVILQF